MADDLIPPQSRGNVDLGDPTTPPPKAPPTIDAFLADQANEAIKAGGDPQMVTARLGQMVQHLRVHPDVHQQANDALAAGMDPMAVAGKLSKMARHVGTAAPVAPAADPTLKYDGTTANAGLVPSALHGATFGLSHKLIAGVDAVGDAVAEGLHHPTENLAPTLTTAYDQNLAAERAAAKQYAAEHPWADRLAEIAGGVGVGLAGGAIAGAAKGAGAVAEVANAGRLAKIGSAVKTGAAAGGVYGVGEASGSPSDYLTTIAKDAGLGAAGSVIALPVVAAAGAVGRAAHIPEATAWAADHVASVLPEGSVKRALTAVGGSIGTRGKAATAIADAAARDEAAGFVPHDTPQGFPVMALDKAGPNVEGLAENIVNRPGTGRAILTQALNDRQGQMRPAVNDALDRLSNTTTADGEVLLRKLSDDAAQRERLTAVQKAVATEAKSATPVAPTTPAEAWRAEIGGTHPNGIGTLRQMADAQRAEAGRLYGAAKEATAGQPVQSETLDQIMQTPAGKSAFGWAKLQMANRNKALPTVETPAPGFSADELKAMGQTTESMAEKAKLMQSRGIPLPDAMQPGQAEVPDPETLHYMKQYLAKLARLGVNDGAQGTIATQAQGALGQWSNIRNELPPVWQVADEAFAKHARLIDALNAGRNILRTQVNPAGAGKKALYTSLDALEQRAPTLAPEEQHALQVGAQSALSDYLTSGKGVKGFVAQLQVPSSPMARRVVLATGDPEAPARLAARLAPRPNLLPAAPPTPAASSELAAGGRGLDVLQHGETAPSTAPARSLALLEDAKAAMAPPERQALQTGAAQAVRGEFAGSGSPNPARVFAASPERVKQVAHAFADQATADQFQNVVQAWANAQQQANRITGNSRTALRGSVEASRDLVGPGQMAALAHGNVTGAAIGVAKGLAKEGQQVARDQLDKEIATVLTKGTVLAIPEARRAAVLREIASRNLLRATALTGGVAAAR